MKKLLLVSSLALLATVAVRADTFSYSPLNGGAATGSTLVNFDGFTLGSTTQATGILTVSFGAPAKVVNGSVTNQYAAPFLSGGNGFGFGPGGTNQPDGQDTTNYLSTGIGSVTLSFSSAQKYIGFLWGSVDTFNTLEFWNAGSLVGSFTGTDITASANGNQGASGTYYVNFNDLSGWFDTVVAKSTTNAFEIDNVSYDSQVHVPDNGTSLTLLGLALVGLAMLRRKF
jgi:hypothetical protein